MATAENAPSARSPVHSIDSCQFEAESIAPWRSPLSRALHRNRSVPFARYLQLATVKLDGTPANRTVVFRGFLNATNCLMFISDLRSEKTNQIQQNPNVEACWYFTKTREQFRICGQITLVTASNDDDSPKNEALNNRKATLQNARQQIWQNISDNARIQFSWPSPKALRMTSPQKPEASTAFNPPYPDPQTPPEAFTLLVLIPHSVDHLELRGEPQNRRLYVKDSGKANKWNVTTVNP